MIVCELLFNRPDPHNPDYSAKEVDYYAWIPANDIENHRLSLRKNLRTGQFEIYRHYYAGRGEEICFAGSFQPALEFANREYQKHHGKSGLDKPCLHRKPQQSQWCPERHQVRNAEAHQERGEE